MGRFNIGAAGAAAGGFQQGLASFQDQQERTLRLGEERAERTQRMTLADAQNKRQMKMLERQDAEQQLMTEAQQAAMKPIEDERKAFEEAAAKTGAAPQAYQPSKRALLRAGQAQTDYFHMKGRLDLGEKSWRQTEELRATMRAPAAKKLLDKVVRGGDITQELTEFDEDMDDGLGLQKVEEFKAPGGERAYKVWQRRRFDGKGIGEPRIVTAKGLIESATMAVQDPKGAAEMLRKSYLENLDSANKEREAAAKAKAAREDEDHKQRGRLDLDDRRTNNDMRLDGVRTANDVKVKTTAGAGDVAAVRQALTQERIAADKNVDQILAQLKDTTRSSEKPGLQAELAVAKKNAADIRDKLSRFGDEKTSLGAAGGSAAKAGPAPPTKLLKDGVNTKFKNGQVWTLRDGKPVQVQ